MVPAAKAYESKNSSLQKEVRSFFNKELQCLADNIYYEAGTESFEGKNAVAQVVLNRVNSGKFANSVCAVVYQKTGSTYQFSWVGMSVSKNKNPYQWEESVIVAKKALTSPVAHDILYKEKAMYYHANYVKPNWNLPRVTQIGTHIFYKERNKI